MKRILFPTLLFFLLSAVVFSQAPAQQKTQPATVAPAAPRPRPAAAADSTKKIEALTAEIEKLKADQAKQKLEEEKIQKAEQLVQEWFRRWNAMADGSSESRDRFMELYSPQAMHISGPSDKQIGAAIYEGAEEIREMAKGLPEKYGRVAFYIKVRTIQEKTFDLLNASAVPSGAILVAVEFGGSFEMRDTKKRFMVPGTAFFDIQDGKIERARIYFARGEDSEVIGSYDSGV